MQNGQRVIRVIHVGPSTQAHGGISEIIANFLRDQSKDPEISSVAVATTYAGLRGPVGDTVAYAIACFHILRACLERPRPILHVHHTWYGGALRKGLIVRMARLLGVPCVGADQGSEPLYSKSGAVQRWWIRGTWRRCNVLVTVSNHAKEFLTSHVQTRVEVMPNAVALPDLDGPPSTASSDSPPSFLFLGNDMRRKGCPDLLKAFDLLCEWGVPARMVLAGVDREDEVHAWIERGGHEGRVRMHGWVAGEDKAKVLREASVFVLPSYREGMPVAILEAMSYALPVISTPIASIPEAVRHEETGLLVQPGDVNGLAEAMKRLALDAPLRRAMGDAGRELIRKEFSLESIGQSMKKIYFDLAE